MGKGYSLGELAQLVSGTLCGDPSLHIAGIKGYQNAGPEDITFAADARMLVKVIDSRARALVIPADCEAEKPHIKVGNPRLAFAKLLHAFAPKYDRTLGTHPTAVLGPGVELGAGCSIGAHAVIEAGARLGDNVMIYPGVYIGPDVQIGDDCVIYANAVVETGCILGTRVFIHAGTVIGSDGFGYVSDQSGHVKVPQIGNVVIGDDVEIGANVTIDRATCDSTVIGRGTKIDNLVQIGHNVEVGENCLIVAMAGVSGSSVIGDGSIIAGQAGVVGHLRIGPGSRVLARGMVTNDLPPGSVVSGAPARAHQEELRIKAASRRLPELSTTIRDLKRRLEEIEKTL
jgi:UDP-3-O-[3-hydroxymyristoyl] glucosamine N-acyltransferase